MALSQRLDLRQTQSLVMTPQLQQAIKLLQLSNIELTEFVDREIEQNPLLEREDGDGAPSAAADGVDPQGEPEPAEPVALRDSAEAATSDTLPAGADSPLDTDYENVWTNNGPVDEAGGESLADWGGRSGRTDFEDDCSSLEQTLSRDESLRDHLEGQINVDLADPVDRLIGAALIDLLDEAGYLTGDIAVLADQLDCSVERVQAILARLQRLDPPGIFARSLAECLAIQLRDRNRCDPAMQALLDHLDLLAQRNMPALMKVCGVDADDLADMIAELKALNPKPALAFDHIVAQTLVPDIVMRPQQGGGWIIELNMDTLPRVLINQRYLARVSGGMRNKADRDYLNERLHSANWLVKSLHQRANTILKVATEIVQQQEAFFAKGVQYLKPLILRDIAEAIGMHESTISRVTTNKFMATPRGVFELKYFFTSSINSANGQAAHSAEAVRHRIKVLIDGEPPGAVLSDDQLVDILRKDGIDIARRTVAKYREALRIPSSVQRRRDKTLRRK